MNFLCIVIMLYFLVESPLFLIRQNRLDDAYEKLCYIGKINRSPNEPQLTNALDNTVREDVDLLGASPLYNYNGA